MEITRDRTATRQKHAKIVKSSENLTKIYFALYVVLRITNSVTHFFQRKMTDPYHSGLALSCNQAVETAKNVFEQRFSA